jgi:cold shock protein
VCYSGNSPHYVAKLRVVDPLLERTVRSAIPVREVLEVPMTTGTIKKVVSDRGFGFIAAEDEKEYFFHRGGLDSSIDFDRLIGGERVQFEVEASPKGPRAVQVRSA